MYDWTIIDQIFDTYLERGGKPNVAISQMPKALIDIMSTCLEVAGAAYPTEYKGNKIISTPGNSLVPYFKGKDKMNHQTIYWEHEGNRGMIDGKWKIVSQCGQPWELYNLEKDRTELNDLTDKFPDKAERLTSNWQKWADEVGVVPWSKTGGCYKVHDFTKEYDKK